MKTLLGLLIVLYVFISVSADCGQTCASDEVCFANATACACNTTAYPYTGGYPKPIIDCTGGSLNIYLSKCWMEINRYNTSNISLRDPTCLAKREIVNNTAQMAVHQSLINNLCNNTMEVNTTHVTYMNALYIYGNSGLVQAQRNFIMNVSCTLSLTMSIILNITLKPILGTTTINVPGGNTTYSVFMTAYKDSTYSSLLSDTDPLYVESYVYIGVAIPDLDSGLKLKVTNIYAFPGEASTPVFNLLTNGCKASGLAGGQMDVISNGVGNEARFEMKVFQISGFNSVKLSADVIICKDDCATNCNSKTKSERAQGNTVTVSISLDASDGYFLNSANSFSAAWILSTLTMSWIFVILM